MTERDPAAVWKYATAVAVSLLIGLISGQFIPNRNIVTTDQMNAAIVPLQSALNQQNQETADLKDQVSRLTGELRARDLISKIQ